MKTSVIAVVVALVVGVAMGALIARNGEEPCPIGNTSKPELTTTDAASATTVADRAADKSAEEELAKRVEDLTEENKRLRELAQSLEQRAQLPESPPSEKSDSPDLQPDATQPPELSGPDRGRREERMAAWREERSRLHERVSDYLQQDYDNTTDPAVRERLIALGDYNVQLQELRRAMSKAKTDEERRSIRENMMETMRTVQDLTFDQQDYLLRNLADEYGIKDTEQQEKFVESIRQLQRNPYFRSSRSIGMFPSFGGPSPGGRPPRGSR